MPGLAGAAYDGPLGSSRSAAAVGRSEEIDRAFRDTFSTLDRRISLFLSLPLSTLDQLALQKKIDKIGHQSNRSTEGA